MSLFIKRSNLPSLLITLVAIGFAREARAGWLRSCLEKLWQIAVYSEDNGGIRENPYASPGYYASPPVNSDNHGYVGLMKRTIGGYFYILPPALGKKLPPNFILYPGLSDEDLRARKAGDIDWDSEDTRGGCTIWGFVSKERLPYVKRKGYLVPLDRFEEKLPPPENPFADPQ